MFEAACAPKQQGSVAPEESSPSRTHDTSKAGTPTGTSSSQTEEQDQSRTPTASEGPSFQGFDHEDGGPVTSTPVAPLARKAKGNIFKKADGSLSSATESPHEQLRRDIANLHLDGSSIEISESSTDHIPASASNLSISSFSSVQSAKEQSSAVSNKGKGRVVPDLRTKALQNVALGAPPKAKGSIFTERPSVSYTNAHPLSSADILTKEEPKSKLPSIFSANPATARNMVPVFSRMQQQIFAPPPAQATGSTAQQRMLKQLLKEAEEEKRAGVPAGSASPARSPARLNVVKQMTSMAQNISLSTDNDTDYSARPADQTDAYRSEGLGVRNYELDDSFDDSDEDVIDEVYTQRQSDQPAMSQTYAMEGDESFDSTGWRPRENLEVNTIGTTNDTLFGLGNRPPVGRQFALQDGLSGNEPDSFALETPIRPRH
jgi:hypothetical protein